MDLLDEGHVFFPKEKLIAAGVERVELSEELLTDLHGCDTSEEAGSVW